MLAPENVLRGTIMVIFGFIEVLDIVKAGDKQRDAHLPDKIDQSVAPVELMVMYPGITDPKQERQQAGGFSW